MNHTTWIAFTDELQKIAQVKKRMEPKAQISPVQEQPAFQSGAALATMPQLDTKTHSGISDLL